MSEVLRKKCCLSPDVHSRDEYIFFNETISFFSFYCAAVTFLLILFFVWKTKKSMIKFAFPSYAQPSINNTDFKAFSLERLNTQ